MIRSLYVRTSRRLVWDMEYVEIAQYKRLRNGNKVIMASCDGCSCDIVATT